MACGGDQFLASSIGTWQIIPNDPSGRYSLQSCPAGYAIMNMEYIDPASSDPDKNDPYMRQKCVPCGQSQYTVPNGYICTQCPSKAKCNNGVFNLDTTPGT
jgi:hypothetical protein